MSFNHVFNAKCTQPVSIRNETIFRQEKEAFRLFNPQSDISVRPELIEGRWEGVNRLSPNGIGLLD